MRKIKPISEARSRGIGSGTAKGMVKKVLLCIAGGSMVVSLFLTSSIKAEAKSPVYQTSQSDDGIPKEIREVFEKVGEDFGICPELMEAMAYRESRFVESVKSGNYYGIMQVNVKIHKDRIEKYGYTADDLLKAEPCITVAADYLKELFDTYGDDDPLILMYYSGNSKAIPNYKEYGWTCPYVKSTLARAAEYERKHGK